MTWKTKVSLKIPSYNKKMSRHVSRAKYENLKSIATKWKNECESLREKLVVVQDIENDLDQLEEMNASLQEENETLKRKLKERLPDSDLLEELETENKNFRKEIRGLKRENKEAVDKYQNKVSHLERDLLLKDGKIQRLEEAQKDLRERYKELKEDYREQQRWSRQKN